MLLADIDSLFVKYIFIYNNNNAAAQQKQALTGYFLVDTRIIIPSSNLLYNFRSQATYSRRLNSYLLRFQDYSFTFWFLELFLVISTSSSLCSNLGSRFPLAS